MSRPSRKCRKDSDTRLALARSEYRTVRAGLPANRTALVTSSETRSSAVAAMPSLIPRQESRNERVYRRAQNGEVGSVTRGTMPASSGRGCPGRADCQADPVAGPVSAVAPLTRGMACPVIAGYLLIAHAKRGYSAVGNSGASQKGSALLAACPDLRRCRHRSPSTTGSPEYGSLLSGLSSSPTTAGPETSIYAKPDTYPSASPAPHRRRSGL